MLIKNYALIIKFLALLKFENCLGSCRFNVEPGQVMKQKVENLW